MFARNWTTRRHACILWWLRYFLYDVMNKFQNQQCICSFFAMKQCILISDRQQGCNINWHYYNINTNVFLPKVLPNSIKNSLLLTAALCVNEHMKYELHTSSLFYMPEAHVCMFYLFYISKICFFKVTSVKLTELKKLNFYWTSIIVFFLVHLALSLHIARGLHT